MVCNLVTYRARSAVREVGYALGFPRPLVDRVAKALETYDSVMVRRDLEAEGGFAEFFAPAVARAADRRRRRAGSPTAPLRRAADGAVRSTDGPAQRRPRRSMPLAPGDACDRAGRPRHVGRRGRPGRHAGQRPLAARASDERRATDGARPGASAAAAGDSATAVDGATRRRTTTPNRRVACRAWLPDMPAEASSRIAPARRVDSTARTRPSAGTSRTAPAARCASGAGLGASSMGAANALPTRSLPRPRSPRRSGCRRGIAGWS